MTQEAQQILAAFDALSPTEQRQVAAILLRRALPEDENEFPETAFVETADALFLELDIREAQVGEPKAR
jgi:hypothetical protein